MTVRFIGGGNWSKQLSSRKSLTNFITWCCIKYTLSWAGFQLTTLEVIGTDCTDSCKSNYHTITTTMARILCGSIEWYNPRTICFSLSKNNLFFIIQEEPFVFHYPRTICFSLSRKNNLFFIIQEQLVFHYPGRTICFSLSKKNNLFFIIQEEQFVFHYLRRTICFSFCKKNNLFFIIQEEQFVFHYPRRTIYPCSEQKYLWSLKCKYIKVNLFVLFIELEELQKLEKVKELLSTLSRSKIIVMRYLFSFLNQ